MQKVKTGKWRPAQVYVSVYLLTSRPIPTRHFHFRAVGCGFRMTLCKFRSLLALIYMYLNYILISYVESDEEQVDSYIRYMYIINRLLNVYCEIFRMSSYSGGIRTRAI